jgi:serine/threonine-protein kinase
MVTSEPEGEGERTFAPGEKFGGYVVDRLLGRGAFGAVYEARRLPLQRRVALKILHERMAGRSEAVARFIREAELVARFEHPHIVAVSDVGAHEGVPYLAMEFLEGETLEAALVREGAQSLTVVLAWALPILSALAAVHDRGVVHRDLKPENLFLVQLPTGEVQPKVLDFGIAKVREPTHELTRTNALMGTPHYMSPEQAQESKHVDARSDQWSFGVILYRCLAGRTPFRGESLLSLLTAIAVAPIAPVSSVAPGIPVEFDGVLGRALERDPARRFPSMREFARALLPYADAPTRARWATHFGYNPRHDPPSSAAAPATPTLDMMGDAGRAPTLPPRTMVTPTVATGTLPLRVGPTGTLLPNAGTLQPHAQTLEPEGKRSGGMARAGAGIALVMLAAAAGIFVQTSRPQRDERLVAATFAVGVRVEPPQATIELDGLVVGTGTFAGAIARDGREHRLRVYASGYDPEALSFRDAPPPGVVRLIASRAPVPIPAAQLATGRPDVTVAPPSVATPLPPVATTPERSPRHGHGSRHHRDEQPVGSSVPIGTLEPRPSPPPLQSGTNGVGIL